MVHDAVDDDSQVRFDAGRSPLGPASAALSVAHHGICITTAAIFGSAAQLRLR